MKKLLFFTSICLTLSSFAQQFDWVQQGKGVHYGTSSGQVMCNDHDGYLYVAGTFVDSLSIGSTTIISPNPSQSPHSIGYYVIKLDSSGNVIWSLAQNWAIDGICTDNEGKLYFVGGKKITCYDINGNFIWLKFVSGNGFQGIYDVATDTLSNLYIVGGYMQEVNFGDSILVGDFILHNHCFLAKYNKNGDFVWARKMEASTDGSLDISKITVSNTKIFVSGWILGNATFGTLPDTVVIRSYPRPNGIRSLDIVLAAYDTAGTLSWAQKGGGMQDDNIWNIASIDDEVYITGEYDTVATFGNGLNVVTLSGNNIFYPMVNKTGNADNVFIAKYNREGTLIWAKDIKRLRGRMYCRGITVNKNKDVLIGGVFEDSMKIENITYTAIGPENVFNIFVAKFTINGDFDWIRQTQAYNDVFSDPMVCDAINDSHGSWYITGALTGKTGFGSVILDSDYWSDTFIARIKDDKIVGTSDLIISSQNHILYPNPSSGNFTISANHQFNYTICIYDVLGSCIMNKTELKNDHQIDLSNQAKGIYFVEIISENQKLVKKLSVQ